MDAGKFLGMWSKRALEKEPGEESADSRVCPLNLKFSVFRRKQGGFYVWT